MAAQSLAVVEEGTDPMHNALLPQFEQMMDPKYVEMYNQNVRGRKLAHEYSIEHLRANPVIIGFGKGKGPQVGEITDTTIKVSNPDGEVKMRVYKPTAEQAKNDPLFASGKAAKPPVFINYHGGGWVLGDVGDDDPLCRHICATTGSVVVDMGYRLAPEYRFPTPIEDSYQGLVYVASHGDELGVDVGRISVGGSSAGGHISAVLSHWARDRGLPNSAKLVFAFLIIPVTDATALNTDLTIRKDSPYKSWTTCEECPFLSYNRMSFFYKHALPQPVTEKVLRDPTISPMHQSNFKDLPPTLVYPAEIDVLNSEGITYANKLKEQGNGWVELVVAKGVPHPFVCQTEATVRARDLFEKVTIRVREANEGKLIKN